MCGIVGTLAFDGLDPKMEAARQEAMIYLMTEILQQTQTRGKDATGISTLFRDGIFTGQKMGIPSPEFVARFGGKKEDYEGYLKGWRRQSQPAALSIGHCRKSSVGNSWENVNNHPIKVGEIVGIHNGTLKNHNNIFKNLGGKRDGIVDSEAIIRLIHHYSENGKLPFTMDMIQEVCKRLEGAYSCLVYSGNNPYQMVTFRDMRPMVYALIRPLKLVVIASDKSFLENAFFKVNKQVKLYNNPQEWPAFTRDAVQFKELPDEHVGIFNMTAEIKEDTDIRDLVEIEKIPRIGKMWKTGYNSQASSYTGGNSHNKRAADNKTNKPNADTSTSGMAEVKSKPVAGDKKVGSGRLYNKELKQYVMLNPEADEETKTSGMTEIDASGKKTKVDVLTQRKNKATSVGKAASCVEDKDKTSEAVIVELDADDNTAGTVSKTSKDKEKVITETKVIDMSIDAEALDEATNRADSLDKFDDDKDVMIALEIAEKTSLKELEPHALCNRMRLFAYKAGIYDGITSAKQKAEFKKSGLRMANEVTDSKDVEKKIRQLKNTAKVLTAIIKELSKSAVDSAVMERAVVNQLELKADLDSDTLSNVFSVGDFKKDTILRQVRDMVATKENRN